MNTVKCKIADKTVAKSTSSRKNYSKRKSTVIIAGNQSKKSRDNNIKSESTPEFRLLVFPSFDKCNSLIYFPHTMSRLLNTGDVDGLKRNMRSYFDKDCVVEFCGHFKWDYHKLLSMFHITCDLHPDSMHCVYNTKVEGNQITATMYFKYTDNSYLNDVITSNIEDPELRRLLSCTRAKMLQNDALRTTLGTCSAEEDVVVYGKTDFAITVDNISKKVISMRLIPDLTSLKKAASGLEEQAAEI